ncbi:MAG TPA: cytochrome P450 [Pseudonocardia sp.]|jgi:cholest-4-en-3-one 26-monooxygenase|nr:cytochrome P450 [Pseudonocardia sp.]
MPTEFAFPYRDIDFSDMSLFAAGPPYELFREMRETAPVCWSSAPSGWPDFEGPGYWNLTRAQDIVAVSRQPEIFSSWACGVTIPGDAVGGLDSIRAMMIGKDHPEHTRQRKVVTSVFTSRRVQALEPIMRDRISALIDGVIERGECDFVEDVAGPLPMQMVADLLGVPEEDWPRLFGWTDSIIGFYDTDLQAQLPAETAIAEASAYLTELDTHRRRYPKDDLITVIGKAEVDGERLAADQRAGLFIQLFAAGVDTTRATLALGIEALATYPDQRRALLADPGTLLPSAIEEINRWASVVQYMRRTATSDTEIAGQRIHAGDAIVMWHASANRDPAVFDSPDTFDVARSRCPHQAFGAGGRHHCLGAPLARLELTVAFAEILRRMPDIELTGPIQRLTGNWLQSVKSMPIAYPAGPREQR